MQVFISIALILGDGIYNLIKIILITITEMWRASSKQLPVVTEVQGELVTFIVTLNLDLYGILAMDNKELVALWKTTELNGVNYLLKIIFDYLLPESSIETSGIIH